MSSHACRSDLRALVLGLVVAGCSEFSPPEVTTEGGSTAMTAMTGPDPTTTGASAPTTTTPDATTTTGEPGDTTDASAVTTEQPPPAETTAGESTTERPQGEPPTPRCTFVAEPGLLATTCGGAAGCEVRGVWSLSCEDGSFRETVVATPGGGALFHTQAQAEATFAVQYEVFALTDAGPALLEIFVTPEAMDPAAQVLARADGQVELFVQKFSSDPVLHYVQGGGFELDGDSTPFAIREDMRYAYMATVRGDDVPALLFRRPEADGMYALFDLPEGRVEQLFVADDAVPRWFHAAGGKQWVSWQDNVDDTLVAREVGADPATPGTPLLQLPANLTSIQSAALSRFGDGSHAVVLTSGHVLANAPWTYAEDLGGVDVDCEEPTCADGCEAAPACAEAEVNTRTLALQATDTATRMWHLECGRAYTVTWQEGSFFDPFCLCDKCTCDEFEDDVVEETCELVGSSLAPDPDAPGELQRTEVWRRPLAFTEEGDLFTRQVASGSRMWLLTESEHPEPRQLLWAIDADATGP
jgi:hypothetical protein